MTNMEKDFREAIIECCERNSLCWVRGSKARKSIKAFLEKNGYSIDDLRAFWLQPEKTLGPFSKLPLSFRNCLADSGYFHIEESHFLTYSVLRTLSYGSIAELGGFIVHLGWKIKENYLPRIGSKSSRWRRIIIRLGRELILKCIFLSGIFLRLFRFTIFYRAPFAHMLWNYAKVDAWDLIHNYINTMPVDPRISPVFKCTKRQVVSCGFVGIDLLPSQGRLYFLESNFNPGHYIERHKLFPEGDTVCNHLIDWASENGFCDIVFYPSNIGEIFNRDLEQAWQKIANKKNLRLEIIDDPIVGSPWPRRKTIFMDIRTNHTLYVNGRALEGPITRLISKKGLMEKEIKSFNEGVPEGKKILIPKTIHSHAEVPKTNDASRFPNIIVKNAVLDMTLGLKLFKTENLPYNANSWPNIAYEYLVPDLVLKENHGVIEEFVYIFRAYLLITPDGPVYVGARKDVSAVPIPASLPSGPVKDMVPYITNLHLGDYSVSHNEIEDRACKDAILSIGSVIFNFIKKKHILTIDQ